MWAIQVVRADQDYSYIGSFKTEVEAIAYRKDNNLVEYGRNKSGVMVQHKVIKHCNSTGSAKKSFTGLPDTVEDRPV